MPPGRSRTRPSEAATALAFLVADGSADAARAGIVGASIGADLAAVASSQDLGVLATVAISTRFDLVTSLLDGRARSLGPFACIAGRRLGARARARSTPQPPLK